MAKAIQTAVVKVMGSLDPSVAKTVADVNKKFSGLKAGVAVAGAGIAVAGAAIAGATTAAVAFGKTSLDAAAKFETGMSNIATLLDGDTATVNKRIAEMGDDIMGVAKKTGLATDDLSNGMYQIVSALGDSADATSQLEVAAKAAKAGGATTVDAINLLSAVTKGYGDTSGEAWSKASDLAFQTVKLGQTSFPELAASMGKVVPIASALNISQEELFGSFATLTGVTGSTAEVSTQLKSVFSGLMTPSTALSAKISELGYESANAMLDQLGLIGTLDKLSAACGDDKQAVAKLFSSVEAQTAVLALAGSQTENWVQKTESMAGAANATSNAFDKQTDNLQGKLAKMKQVFEAFKIKVGNILIPIVTDFVDKAIPKIEKVFDMIFPILKKVYSAAKPVIDGISNAIEAVMPIIGEIASFIMSSMESITPVIKSIVKSVGKIIKSVLPLIKTVFKYVVGIIKAISPVLQRVGNLIANVVEKIVPLVQVVTDTVTSILEAVMPVIDGVIAGIMPLIDAAVNSVGKILDAVIPVINGIVKQVTKSIQPIIKTVLKSVGGIIKAISPVLQRVGNLIANVVEKIAPLVQVVIDTVTSILEAVMPVIDGVIAGIMPLIDAVVNSVGKILDAVLPVINVIVKQVTPIIIKIMEALTPLIDMFMEIFGPVIIAELERIVNVICYLMPVIETAVNAIIPIIEYSVNKLILKINLITDVFKNVIDFVKNVFTGNWQGALENLKNIATAPIKYISGLFENIITVVDRIIAVVKEKFPVFGVVIQSFRDSLQPVIDGIKGVFSGLIDFIQNVFTGNWSAAWESVKSIFGNAFNALKGLAKAPLNAVISLVNSAIGGLNNLHISIPDWVPGFGGKEFGINIPQIPMLATGGIATQPSICGEGGYPEYVISTDPKYREQNQKTVLEAANVIGALETAQNEGSSVRSLFKKFNGKGSSSTVNNNSESTAYRIEFSPVINISGNTNNARSIADEVMKVFDDYAPELADKIKAVLATAREGSYGI